MKIPALRFLPLLIAPALMAFPALQAQEPPTADRSSEESHKKKIIGDPPQLRFIPIEDGKRIELNAVIANKNTKKPPEPDLGGILILLEWIEVEHEEFSEWAFENPLKADATDLRKAVQKWIKEDDARIIETAVVHARSGQRAQIESIHEVIYPTEYDDARFPSTLTLDEAEGPLVPPNGKAYETRNVGTTVEVDPVVEADKQVIDLNLSPEIVTYVDDLEWVTETGGEELVVRQPLFYTMKATTQLTLKNGGYALIGTLRTPQDALGMMVRDDDDDDDDNDDDDDDDDDDRIVLLFVRADVS